MKLAVLSDIHGNDIAFAACLSYLKQQDIDAYCLLGDYIGELPAYVIPWRCYIGSWKKSVAISSAVIRKSIS